MVLKKYMLLICTLIIIFISCERKNENLIETITPLDEDSTILSQQQKDTNIAPGSFEKAEGGYTVVECYTTSDSLNGKIVKVRGRVVKFNAGIMDRNWIHIQDGTGGTNSFDLTITSNDIVAVGDVILVSGTLSMNKDFGMDLKYPVIIEEAEITIENK